MPRVRLYSIQFDSTGIVLAPLSHAQQSDSRKLRVVREKGSVKTTALSVARDSQCFARLRIFFPYIIEDMLVRIS